MELSSVTSSVVEKFNCVFSTTLEVTHLNVFGTKMKFAFTDYNKPATQLNVVSEDLCHSPASGARR